MRKLPIGVQNFIELIDKECIYVDKTIYIYISCSSLEQARFSYHVHVASGSPCCYLR